MAFELVESYPWTDISGTSGFFKNPGSLTYHADALNLVGGPGATIGATGIVSSRSILFYMDTSAQNIYKDEPVSLGFSAKAVTSTGAIMTLSIKSHTGTTLWSDFCVLDSFSYVLHTWSTSASGWGSDPGRLQFEIAFFPANPVSGCEIEYFQMITGKFYPDFEDGQLYGPRATWTVYD
jgi:hypothetical protein